MKQKYFYNLHYKIVKKIFFQLTFKRMVFMQKFTFTNMFLDPIKFGSPNITEILEPNEFVMLLISAR